MQSGLGSKGNALALACAKLYLNERVVAFFQEDEIPQLRVLTNRGTGGRGTPERNEYEL